MFEHAQTPFNSIPVLYKLACHVYGINEFTSAFDVCSITYYYYLAEIFHADFIFFFCAKA